MAAGLPNSLADIFIAFVSLTVDEEVVFPLAFFAGPGFDVCKINIAGFEYVQHVGQCTCFVGGAEKHRGFVVAGPFCVLLADDQEAGNIVGNILDIFTDDFQAVQFSGYA